MWKKRQRKDNGVPFSSKTWSLLADDTATAALYHCSITS